MKFYLFIATLLVLPFGCKGQPLNDFYQSKRFQNYWYAGKAELSSFELSQARYGEVHEGEAVLIFVTEDFSEKNRLNWTIRVIIRPMPFPFLN